MLRSILLDRVKYVLFFRLIFNINKKFNHHDENAEKSKYSFDTLKHTQLEEEEEHSTFRRSGGIGCNPKIVLKARCFFLHS